MLRQLPASPGVYLMKAADGRVLYVGKADLLRNRVRSYFGSKAGSKWDLGPKPNSKQAYRTCLTPLELMP